MNIEKRPKEIDEYNCSGILEMDCFIGTKFGFSTLLALTERITRGKYVRFLPAKTIS